MSHKNSAARRGVGRPAKFKEEYIEQARKLCLLGATDTELADFFGVQPRTLYRWKLEHKEFCQAIKAGKDIADDAIERSLYQRGRGYEYDAVKIFMPVGATEPVYAHYRKHMPPDTAAAIFWLKNRRPERWKDMRSNELSGPNGGPVPIEEKPDLITMARKVAFAMNLALRQQQAQTRLEGTCSEKEEPE